MRRTALAFLMGIGLGLGPASALAQPNDVPSITIRIYDYARIPTESIEEAQQHVTDLYAAIGVQAVWARTVRPTESRAYSLERDPRELLINILSPTMSRRLAVAEETLGLAAVSLLDGGTIAYILFDRICQVAVTAATSPASVLGVVIAHELGHLLLPHGSHSRTGLMRPIWNAVDFGVVNHQQLNFTRAQARSIHRLLSRRTQPASSSPAFLLQQNDSAAMLHEKSEQVELASHEVK